MVRILYEHVEAQGDCLAFSFLHGNHEALQQLSFAELEHLAGAVAGALSRESDPEHAFGGDCVLLLFEPGLEFVVAFLGCLIAGRPAVPLRPPRTALDLKWVQQVVSKVGASCILVDPATHARCIQLGASQQVLQCMQVVDWLADRELVAANRRYRPSALPATDATAFVQFTSGSTGSPKGVVVGHDNVLDNQGVIASAFGHGDRTTVVGWLPHYHDMGLIGNILQPIFLGRPCHLMAPATFLQRPRRWLQAIADHDHVTSGGPNFAYQHCLTSISDQELEQEPRLDLSRWQLAFVGAEPIRPETMRGFRERFAPFGFSRGALYPCYGLAESTLMLAGGTLGDGARTLVVSRTEVDVGRVQATSAKDPMAVEVVACGVTYGDNEVMVVDPETGAELPEQRVGEIWARGPSVAAGYFGDEAATAERFCAQRLPGHNPVGCFGAGHMDPVGDGFLRTGDLGFLRNGQLFVTGRVGALIILNGRNFYPHDFESLLQGLHDSCRVSGSAAFAVPTETGAALVMVQEVRGRAVRQLDPAKLLRAARAKVSAQFGVRLHDLVLTRDSILRTSSGKVRYRENQQLYLAGGFRRADVPQDRGEPARDEHAAN